MNELFVKLRLGAQSVKLLSTLRDPMQLRQCTTRQQHLFFSYVIWYAFFAVDHPLCDV